jgi:ABC-type antimicrobial peptide transport system permease subunit
MATFRRGNLKLAISSLKSAKARSFLTMLGVVIGVTAVVCVVCIGAGVRQQIGAQINHFGKDLITVRPGGNQNLSQNLLAGSGLPTASSRLLSADDLKTVQHAKGVKYAVPLSVVSGSASGDYTVNAPLVIATGQELPEAINQKITYGGFFDESDTADEVVLGSAIATRLFSDRAPLGQTLTFRGHSFIVEGVFSDFNAAPFSLSTDFNNAVFMSYNTARSLAGNLGVYQILVKPADTAQTAQVAGAIETALAASHGGARDTSVLTPQENDEASSQIVHLLTVLIIGVAAIALIVGGVGIMDVLLVSVTERMHEIGIRKAIGATNRQILRQFMMEALVLSATGALIGLLLSLATVGLLRLFSSLQPVLVWQVLVVAPLVAIAIGIIFGTAPALKAARKDPIEALRHE